MSNPETNRPLEACGYNPALGVALTLHNNQFRKLIRAPRKAASNRAGVTVEVAKTIDDAIDRLRDQLDPLMQQYWGIDRPLYDAYRKARRLAGLPRQKLSDEEKARAKERAKQRAAANADSTGPERFSPTRASEPVSTRNGTEAEAGSGSELAG